MLRCRAMKGPVGRAALAIAWLLVAIVISLGAAGIVTGMAHQPGTPARAELTYAGDAAMEPALAALEAELPALSADLRRLSDLGRGALTALIAMDTQAMIRTHPDVAGSVNDALVRCIEACLACAQTCVSCADACLAEKKVDQLRQCIRLNLDCADICDATSRIVSRQTAFEPEMARAALQACAEACRLCGEECEQHASHHEHCRVCAKACRRCEEACNSLLQKL